MSDFNSKEYINSYNKANYKAITFRLKKDKAIIVKDFIKNSKMSLNKFIETAIDEKIERMKTH